MKKIDLFVGSVTVFFKQIKPKLKNAGLKAGLTELRTYSF